jgi:hypothetical protein
MLLADLVYGRRESAPACSIQVCGDGSIVVVVQIVTLFYLLSAMSCYEVKWFSPCQLGMGGK